MAKDPAFLFYSADFYMGTVGMTDAQVGQYIRLMCLQHQQGHLSHELVKTVVGSKMDPSVLAKFVQDENGMYYNARLEAETNRRNEYTKSRRNNARSKKHMGEHMDEHMGEHSVSEANTHMHKHMETETETETVNINTRGGAGGDAKSGRTKFTPPSVDEVAAYMQERGMKPEAERFIDHYTANGWKVGRNPMKDWKSAVRNWGRNAFDRNKPQEEPKVYEEFTGW